MGTDRPVTIRDIARELDLSTATVSLGLRGSVKVRPETRAAIREAAERLGYRRKPAFSALGSMAHRHAANREGLPIAYVDEPASTGRVQRVKQSIEGIEAGCREMGYRLEFFSLKEYPPRQLHRLLDARGISGVILGFLNSADLLREADWSRIALVAKSLYGFHLPVHTVRASRYFCEYQTILEAYAHGYRRSLVVIPWHFFRLPLQDDFDRYAAVTAALKRIGPIEDGWIRTVDHPWEGEEKPWRHMVEQHQPDALVGFVGANYDWLQRAGYRMPEDFAFCLPELNLDRPQYQRVAGTLSCEFEIGRACVLRLDQLIRLAETGVPDLPMDLVVNCPWREGDTMPHRPPPS